MRAQTSGLCLLLSLLFAWCVLAPRDVHVETPQPAVVVIAPQGEPMSFPKTVRQTPVKHGDEMAVTVSTVQIARNYYDTVVFDDSADKRHNGWLLGGYVIDKSSTRAETREAAMDQHREALYAARTEFPKAPTS